VNNPTRMASRRFASAAVMLLSLAAVALPAADIVAPPPEAPTEIFSLAVGDSEVELTLLGAWTLGASVGAGLLFAPGLSPQLTTSFPTLELSPLFTQTPDVTIQLRMMRKYFLELSVLGSFADNSIVAGYDGEPGEVLRQVRVGTRGIGQEQSRFLQVPEQDRSSLGASARFATGASVNDLLLRWDSSGTKTKSFLGKNELWEETHLPASYIRGMYFFLPDTAVNSLQVFLEDREGTLAGSDGRSYRPAGFDDVILDSTNGLVTLRKVRAGRVLVFYRKGGADVGSTVGATLPDDTSGKRDPTALTPFNWGITYLGIDMDAERLATVPGTGDCLLLWEPGDNSPFEICNTYQFEATPPSDVSRVSIDFPAISGSGQPPTGLPAPRIDVPNRRFTVTRYTDSTGTHRYENLYPFYDKDPTGLLYGPGRDSLEGGLGWKIRGQFRTPVDRYVLESDIVPGSVQVSLNGVTETRFEVQPESGTLTLLFDVQPSDRLDVRWRKASEGLSGGDILFTWRDRIPLSETILLDLSAGIRWNADPWSYSPEPYARSGTMIASAGLSGKGANLDWSITAAAAVTNPDTTGTLRLFGMEGHSLGVNLSEEAAYPARAPGTTIPLLTLTESNRGKLLYRSLAYANGFRMGPYNVAGTSESSTAGQTLVMDFDVQAGQWVGTQLPVAGGADTDLTDARAITIRLRTDGVSTSGAGFQVHLQLGTLGEDLDSDLVLDAEASATVAGFPFNTSFGAVLKVGAGPDLLGNGLVDTEDRNGNGILDSEAGSRLVTIDPSALAFTGDSAWAVVTHTFTSDERALLAATRAVRIVITSAVSSSGKVLIDALSIEKSPFWTQNVPPAPPTGTLSAREAAETLLGAGDPGSGRRLEDAFPGVVRRFHAGSAGQEVLQFTWQGVGTAGARLTGYAFQGTGGIAYDAIVLYTRATGGAVASGTTLAFSLRDSAGAGIAWSLDGSVLSDGAWHELTVLRDSLSLTVDGAAVAATVQWDASSGDLAHLTLDVSGSGALADGAVSLDEIQCTEPRIALGAALAAELSARFPGTILAAGGVTILSNVTIDERLSLATAGFSPLYGIPLSTEDLSSRTRLGADVLYTRIQADILLRETAGAFSASGSHRLTFPAVSSPVVFTDAFAVAPGGDASRENTLDIRTGSIASLRIASQAQSIDEQLSQSWSAQAVVTPVPAVSLSSQAGLSQTMAGYSAQHDWYAARWLRDFALLAPWGGGIDVARGGKLAARAAFTPQAEAQPWEAEAGFSAAAAGSAYTDTARTQENSLDMSAAVSYRFGQGASAASVGLRYTRALAMTTREIAGPAFAAEASAFAGALRGQGYVLTGVPFVEIFADPSTAVLAAWPAALETGSYSPAATLSFQRTYGSVPRDLLVPSLVELSVGRRIERTADLAQSVLSVRPRVVNRALNLFGKLGSLPLSDFFRTDDYSLGLNGSLEQAAGRPLQWTLIAAEASAVLSGFSGEELTLLETFRREEDSDDTDEVDVVLSSETQLLYDWAFRPAGGVPLRFLPAPVAAGGYFTHRESAVLTVRWQDAGAFHPLNVTLGHATSLVFPDRGWLKASAGLGVDLESLTDGAVATRFAVRLGLEANLTF
jgi:hypothetical protein